MSPTDVVDGEMVENVVSLSRAAAEGEDACRAGDDEGEGVEGGKTVVLGVRLDAQSRELLTWELVKVLEPEDRVIALHVLPNAAAAFSADCSGPNGNSSSCSTLISLVKSFDTVLAVYEGTFHSFELGLTRYCQLTWRPYG